MSESVFVTGGLPIPDFGDAWFGCAEEPRRILGEDDKLIGHLVVALEQYRLWGSPCHNYEKAQIAAKYQKRLRSLAHWFPKKTTRRNVVARFAWKRVLFGVRELLLATYAPLLKEHVALMEGAPEILGLVVREGASHRLQDVSPKKLRERMLYQRSRRLRKAFRDTEGSDWARSESRYSALAQLHWCLSLALFRMDELNELLVSGKAFVPIRVHSVMSSFDKQRAELLAIAPENVVDELLAARLQVTNSVKIADKLVDVPAGFELATSVHLELSDAALRLATEMLVRRSRALRSKVEEEESPRQVWRHYHELVHVGDWYVLWSMALRQRRVGD